MQLTDVIQNTMDGLGYSLVARTPATGVFSSAEFSQEGLLDFKITIHHSDLLLDLKPSHGFASWRWYDAIGLLKRLEHQGLKIRWTTENTPEEVGQFLEKNIPLLGDIRDRLHFSYFNGVAYK